MSTFIAPPSALSAQHLDFLRSVDSPTLSNAIETVSDRERAEGFIGGKTRCLFPDLGVMAGQALTVKVSNPRGQAAARDGYWAMWEALELMPNPSVIVMQDISGEPSRCAYAGEVMATLASQLGCVGMVTDGGYRDLVEVRDLGFHYFASYAVVSHGNFAVQEVGEPVFLDGQWVKTGDILHGDMNGIVVVPAEALDALSAAVEVVRTRERKLMDFIRSDAFTLEGVKSGREY